MIKIHEDDLNRMLKKAFHAGLCKENREVALNDIWDEYKYHIIETEPSYLDFGGPTKTNTDIT